MLSHAFQFLFFVASWTCIGSTVSYLTDVEWIIFVTGAFTSMFLKELMEWHMKKDR